MRKQRSLESKTAQIIANAITNLTLDLDEVGIVLARTQPTVICNRLDTVIESARFEKEMMNERNYL